MEGGKGVAEVGLQGGGGGFFPFSPFWGALAPPDQKRFRSGF